MLATNNLREKLAEEIRQIPDAKLPEVLGVIHYFRVGVESSAEQSKDTPVSGRDSSAFLEKIRKCIRQPNEAPLGDFSLNLKGFRFDREEANER